MHIEFLWGKGIFIYEKEVKINTNYIKDSVLKKCILYSLWFLDMARVPHSV